MRYLEPRIYALLTMQAKSTTQIIKELYGEDYQSVDLARIQVHKALQNLQDDGLIVSRLCASDTTANRHSKYWGLPGCEFPSTPAIMLVDRVLDALQDGPTQIDELEEKVYSPKERSNPFNSRRRMTKALLRLKDRGLVERVRNEQTGSLMPSTWRLTK